MGQSRWVGSCKDGNGAGVWKDDEAVGEGLRQWTDGQWDRTVYSARLAFGGECSYSGRGMGRATMGFMRVALALLLLLRLQFILCATSLFGLRSPEGHRGRLARALRPQMVNTRVARCRRQVQTCSGRPRLRRDSQRRRFPRCELPPCPLLDEVVDSLEKSASNWRISAIVLDAQHAGKHFVKQLRCT